MDRCLLIVLFSLFGLVGVSEAGSTSQNNSKIKEFYKRYPRADSNKDGVLTVAEMRSYISKWVPGGMTSRTFPPLKTALKRSPGADLNKDGVLTKDELLRYLK